MSTAKIIVTRHLALIEFLTELKFCAADTPVISHATADDVRGKHVVGVLPLHLAALTASVTEIPLAIPAELRGVELSIDQVRQYAGVPVTYIVQKLD